MFCPNCGHQNPENAANCQRCATALAPASAGAGAGKPAPKFKGTMLMTSSDQSFGAPGAARPGPGAQAQFQKTMVGGMSVVDPASLGGGGDEDDSLESKTVMQPSQFDAPRAPPTTGGPPLGAPPRAPAAPPAPPRAPTPPGTGASTMAVDASAFGLPSGPTQPGGGGGFQPTPPAQRPQTPAPQPAAAPRAQTPAPQPAAPPPASPVEEAVSGVASTVAVDASAFGLGGHGAPGGPSPFGAPPNAPQQQQFGAPPNAPPQQQFGAPPNAPPQQQFGAPPNAPPQGAPMGPTGGISSTVAVDISAFGLGGPGMPGGPGGPPGPGGPQGPQPPFGGPQGQPGYPQQQGFPQGPQGFSPQGFPQGQPGYPQQPGAPFGAPNMPQGMQPAPFQQPPAATGGNKTVVLIAVGVFVFLVALSVVAALLLHK